MDQHEQNIFRGTIFTVTVRPDGILESVTAPLGTSGEYPAELYRKEADESIVFLKNHPNVELPFAILVKGNIRRMSKEVREDAAEFGSKYYKCLAVVINSSLSRIIANLFMKFSKPPFPVKLFTDEDKAIEWLKTF